MYRAAGFEWGTPPGLDLASCVEQWANLPLVFQPGSEWNYSVSSDVLGRLVELVSGQACPDQSLQSADLRPAGHERHVVRYRGRGSRCAVRAAAGDAKGGRYDAFGAVGHGRPDCLSGGGGLVSTAGDYHRFTQFLLCRGELEGVRLLTDAPSR